MIFKLFAQSLKSVKNLLNIYCHFCLMSTQTEFEADSNRMNVFNFLFCVVYVELHAGVAVITSP